MDMQNVSNLQIPEGSVRAIHDKDNRLLWGKTAYSVKYAGDTFQQSYSGRNLVYANYEQKSAQGVTWKYDKETGEFTVNGTPSQTYSVPSGVSLFSTPIPAGTYTLVIDNLVQGAKVGIALKQSDGTGRTGFPMAGTNKSVTFSIPSAYPAFDIYLTGMTVGQSISGKFRVMFVSGSSAAVDFEPYVGGIPAPNPDYPQEVQTVTGEQTVEVTGKNLIYTNPRTNEGITFSYNSTNGVTAISGTPALTYAISATNSTFIPAGTYTISIDSPKSFNVGIGTRNASNVRTPTYIPAGSTSVTITRTEPVVGYDIYVSGLTSGTYISGEFELMLEQGSTATAYELYQSHSYTINLGSLELCKIGAYQDYIYKSGEDWYVHKATDGFVANGSEDWARNGSDRQDLSVANIARGSASNNPVMSSRYASRFSTSVNNSVFSSGALDALCVYDTIHASTTEGWKTWLASNNTTFYYALATPTDTKITDATLVGQLNAVHELLTRYGYNATVSGNLPIIISKTNL